MHLITDKGLLEIIKSSIHVPETPKRRKALPSNYKDYIVSYYFSDTPDFILLLYYRDTWLTIYSTSNGHSYIAKSMFSRELFLNGGTVLMGNIVQGQFILSDIQRHSGKDLLNQPFRERMTILNRVYSHDIIRNAVLDPYVLKINDFTDSFHNEIPAFGWLIQHPTKPAIVVTELPEHVDHAPAVASAIPELDKEREYIFTVSYIDVDQYQLEYDGIPLGLAVIPDLKTSKIMRTIAQRMPVKMSSLYHPVLSGWVPTKVV